MKKTLSERCCTSSPLNGTPGAASQRFGHRRCQLYEGTAAGAPYLIGWPSITASLRLYSCLL